MFIYDALNDLITCGDTHIEASELRVRVNDLHKVPPGSYLSGFEKQLEVRVISHTLVNNGSHDHCTHGFYGHMITVHMFLWSHDI